MKLIKRSLMSVLAVLPFASGAQAATPPEQGLQSTSQAWKAAKSKGTHAAFAKFAIEHGDDPRAAVARQQIELPAHAPKTDPEKKVAAVTGIGDAKDAIPAFNPNSLVIV